MAVTITAPVLPTIQPIDGKGVDSNPLTGVGLGNTDQSKVNPGGLTVPPPVTSGTAKVNAPAVVTSGAAISNLNQTKGALDQTTAQMQQQAQAKQVAAQQAAAAQAQQAVQAKADAAQQATIDNNKAETDAKIKAMQQQAVAQSSQANQPSADQLVAKYAADQAHQKLIDDIKSGANKDFYIDSAGIIRDSNTNQPQTYQTNTNPTTSTVDANGNPVATPTQPSTGNAALDTYTAQKTADANQATQAYNDYLAKTKQIQDGTFPLTPAQQSLIDSVNKTLAQSLATQQLANQNYQGGLATLGYTTGIGSSPSIQSGIIKNAIDQGTQKIQDLENTATQAIANLQQGFDTNNLKIIQDSYSAFQTAMAAKDKSITDIFTAVNDNNKQIKSDANLAATTAFDQKMRSDQLTVSQKAQALDEIIRSGTLTLDQQKAAETQWKDQQDIAIQKQASDPFSGALTGNQGVPVTVTATGTPNKMEQATFLAALPQTAQTIVKGLTDYTSNPANLSARQPKGGGMSDREKYLALAHQYDPSFDESQFAARAQYNKDWNSGQTMTNRVAINTGINHLSELAQAASALQNKNFQGGFGPFTTQYNTIGDLLKAHSGDPAVSAYNSAANKVATELAKIYKGSASPSEQEIADERKNLDLGMSPDQMGAVVAMSTNLIAGRLQPMVEQYQNTMGQPPKDPVITDSARQSIVKMREAGINIDISKLDPGNEWRYMDKNEYMRNNPDQASLVANILKTSPGLSDLDMIDALHAAKEAQGQTFNQPLSMGENDSNSFGSHLAQVNNNPGNLRFASQQGSIQGEGGFAKFATPEAGIQALKSQIALDASRGLTLESFVNKFAPPTENDTGTYVKQMAQALGVDPSTKLSELDLNALAKAMARKESSSNIG